MSNENRRASRERLIEVEILTIEAKRRHTKVIADRLEMISEGLGDDDEVKIYLIGQTHKAVFRIPAGELRNRLPIIWERWSNLSDAKGPLMLPCSNGRVDLTLSYSPFPEDHHDFYFETTVTPAISLHSQDRIWADLWALGVPER